MCTKSLKKTNKCNRSLKTPNTSPNTSIKSFKTPSKSLETLNQSLKNNKQITKQTGTKLPNTNMCFSLLLTPSTKKHKNKNTCFLLKHLQNSTQRPKTPRKPPSRWGLLWTAACVAKAVRAPKTPPSPGERGLKNERNGVFFFFWGGGSVLLKFLCCCCFCYFVFVPLVLNCL